MSESGISHKVRDDVDVLVAAFMSDAPGEEIIPLVDRIAAAVDHWSDIPDRAITELRSAIDLMREGKACPTISALLAARSELTRTTAPTPDPSDVPDGSSNPT